MRNSNYRISKNLCIRLVLKQKESNSNLTAELTGYHLNQDKSNAPQRHKMQRSSWTWSTSLFHGCIRDVSSDPRIHRFFQLRAGQECLTTVRAMDPHKTQ